MPAPYMNEVSKVMEMPDVMKYILGTVADIGCGPQKITPDAFGVDGRPLHGVDKVMHGLYLHPTMGTFDTIFSSHFLEHTPNPFDYMINWYEHLKEGGHVVLYLPEKTKYDNYNNPEHCHNWNLEDFIFWVKRSFCGEGKNYKGEHLRKYFELVDAYNDFGTDRYSFVVILKKAELQF